MPNDSEKWNETQIRYIAWLALPKAQRLPKTQEKLAVDFGVHRDTLTDWKQLPGFMDAVNSLARDLVKHDVAEVLGVVRARAKKGELPFVNMMLAMAGLAPDLEAAGKGPQQTTIRVIHDGNADSDD